MMTFRYIDESDINEYIEQGWSVAYVRDYYSYGHARGCFLAEMRDARGAE